MCTHNIHLDDAGTPAESVLSEDGSQYAALIEALIHALQEHVKAAALEAAETFGRCPRLSEDAADTRLVTGVPMARAMYCIEWALAVVERYAVPGPSGADLALLPFAAALPKVCI